MHVDRVASALPLAIRFLRWKGARRGLAALALLAGLSAGAGCGGEADGAGAGARVAWVDPDGEPPYIGSLSVNPKDGSLLMGTNTGLFRIARVGGRPRKTTGTLTTPEGAGRISEALVARYTGPDQLIASGHPSSSAALPPVLGLIRSTDDGRTWTSVSQLGTADFHVLARSGRLLVAPLYGQAQILTSRDGGTTFTPRVGPLPFVDLAVDPRDARRWVGTSEQGTYVSHDQGKTWRQRDTTPHARVVWPEPDALVRVDPGGRVSASADGGVSWQDRGRANGEPQALAADEKGTLYLADLSGEVSRSTDGGATWRTLVGGA